MAERYIRPPLVAREDRPPHAAAWRFRIISTLIVAALVVAAWLIYSAVRQPSSQNPTIGNGLRAPAAVPTSHFAP